MKNEKSDKNLCHSECSEESRLKYEILHFVNSVQNDKGWRLEVRRKRKMKNEKWKIRLKFNTQHATVNTKD